ncbi:hypothetical protein [Novosphingobium sp.]|uniref:hypothetical protein n=1 Tax=Novosphingobium sp. TaxID=1874826 RepID=UPI00334046D1
MDMLVEKINTNFIMIDIRNINPNNIENLEKIFQEYVNGRISIEVYISNIKSEISLVKDSYDLKARSIGILCLFSAAHRRRRTEYRQALQAACWCLEWAENQRQNEFNACLEAAEQRWMHELQDRAQAA